MSDLLVVSLVILGGLAVLGCVVFAMWYFAWREVKKDFHRAAKEWPGSGDWGAP